MIKELFIVALRSLCAYAVLLALGRAVGRKMISRITFFDFIIGVAFGSLAVRISLGSYNSLPDAVCSAVTITLLVLATDWLCLKSALFRRIEEGEPVILITGGRIDDRNLKKVRISLSKLLMLLREKGYFSLEEIAFVALESDGELSVLPKACYRPAYVGDIGAPTGEAKAPLDLIVDGKLLPQNLLLTGKDEAWLLSQLEANGIKSAGDAFYAGLGASGKLFVSRRMDHDT